MVYYAIELPKPWANIEGKPYITVSAKGIANGLSDIPNDGADFGPDTPGTQTSGIQEAYNYALSTLQNIKLLGGLFLIDVPLQIGSQVGLTSAQQAISIEGIGYTYADTPNLSTPATIIGISNNFDVSKYNYMIQIGVPNVPSSGTTQYLGSFGNISLVGVSPNGSNQVNIGIWINNLFGAHIHNIQNPINYGMKQYLIFQEGFGSATGNAPIIENIASYGCALHFEPNGQCFYSNIACNFYSNPPFEIGCTNNNGDTGPVLNNLTLWNPNVANTQQPMIKLIGGAGTNTVINNVIIHDYYGNTPIIDASESTTLYDNATTGAGEFIINGIANEAYSTAPLVNWGNNTKTGVNIVINGINILFSNAAPLLKIASGNTTPFNIIVSGGLLISASNPVTSGTSSSMPQLTSYPLANGQVFDLESIYYSAGTTSTNGTTAGTVVMQTIEYSVSHKKVIINFNGYENNTTTDQTINFPGAFSSYAVITANNTGLTISASTTGITITSPNSTTTYSGIVIVEGY